MDLGLKNKILFVAAFGQGLGKRVLKNVLLCSYPLESFIRLGFTNSVL